MTQLRKKMIAAYSVIIFFICLDRWLKALALTNQTWQFNLIGQIFKINFQANYFIAFSLPLAGRGLLIAIGLIIIAVIFAAAYYWRRRDYVKLAPVLLIIFGASSNFLDRLKHGFVIDYLDLKYFTTFNLADAMIVAGVILLMIILHKQEAV